jgi:uncharacterized protein (TIGR01777 family)
MNIVIPGGTGQIGRILARHFRAQGHRVTLYGRDWTHLKLEDTDLLINLAGRSVNCRYHPRNRQQIYDSRINTTRLLGQTLAKLRNPPKIWMNASTATIYRHALDRPMDELTGELGGNEPGAPDTWNFSIKVAKDWEAAFFAAKLPGTRQIALRSAITMSPDPGGAFSVFLTLVRYGLGGTTGPGNQYVSWIHDLDFVRAVDFLIAREDLDGPINLAAPHPLPNRDFMRLLREAWGIRIGLPAPTPLLELGTWLMRTESELVLKSRQVIPTRLANAGFAFQFPHWVEAAKDLAGRTSRSVPLG